ncbi:acetate kinase [Aestuariirhabdus litorea]|uniref:Acetate kinase n=1 Tax=Aestuariirhabdus litorea TaxID=2528527 RepID=A0A3P3VST3_9GAMM|nr:acetate kinase [Aestuariirhabdus litorea]RRJ85377.1 acetate kinase [Aestuariirhabdus litorea]RWW98601.1 acetate/propionate family kinase [Endozoicomonadaceae bacterium GTF-13]
MTSPNVLIFNCGSSSLKFALIDPISGVEVISGLAERLGEELASIRYSMGGMKQRLELPGADHQEACAQILGLLTEAGLKQQIGAIGHRVVHGGERFRESTLIDAQVMDTIRDCQRLAPLHNPANLIGIEVAQQHFPSLQHVAVFDTAFHQSMPAEAYLYAIPYALYQQHAVRRYGFHGTSYRYVSQRALELLELPTDHSLLCAHLGNGSSAAAIRSGNSVDTTMGLTPLEGLVMGTRSGNVDPNLYDFLASECGYSLQQTSRMLNKESGLLGLSGLSNDMRTLEQAEAEGNERARLAIDIYVFTLARQLAGLATSLPHLDALVFTGGIGENSSRIREATCRRLSILGIDIDLERNVANGAQSQGRISADNNTPAVLVINTNEELMIARDTHHLVAQQVADTEPSPSRHH